MDTIIDAPVVLDCIPEQSGMRTLKTRSCKLAFFVPTKAAAKTLGSYTLAAGWHGARNR